MTQIGTEVTKLVIPTIPERRINSIGRISDFMAQLFHDNGITQELLSDYSDAHHDTSKTGTFFGFGEGRKAREPRKWSGFRGVFAPEVNTLPLILEANFSRVSRDEFEDKQNEAMRRDWGMSSMATIGHETYTVSEIPPIGVAQPSVLCRSTYTHRAGYSSGVDLSEPIDIAGELYRSAQDELGVEGVDVVTRKEDVCALTLSKLIEKLEPYST